MQDNITTLYPGVVNDYTANMHIAQCNIFYEIDNVFTNFLPCSRTINPNNENCLVTCAVSLTCATWLMYAQFFYHLTRIHVHVRMYVHLIMYTKLH